MTEVYIDPPSDLFHTNFDKWFKSFYHFILTEIIPRTIPNNNINRDEYGKILSSDQAMTTWVVAFTDPSVDRNPDSNYELLELLGDRILGAVFSNFVQLKYPNITEKMLTEINATYMSKIKQQEKAKYLNLNKWVRTNMDTTIHTYEDLFESLFGALFKIGDSLIGKGNGYALCNNLISNLYYDLSVDFNEILSRPTSQIKEIFEKLNWSTLRDEKFNLDELGVPTIIKDKSGSQNKWRFRLELTSTAVEFLQANRKWDAGGPVLTTVEGKNKKTVKNEGYQGALTALKNRFGIDFKWASDYVDEKNKRETESLAGIRMKEEEILKLIFPKSKKSGNRQFLQLIGIDKTDKNTILLSINSEFDVPLSDLKNFALRYYSNKGRVSPNISVNYIPNYE